MAAGRAAVAMACVLFFTGCSMQNGGPAARNGGTIYVALPGPPVSLNPLVAHDAASQRAYTPIFPLLYAAQADLSVGPELAAAQPYYSDAGQTLTVPLRSDAKWSDGKPITADDVVYTITTEMNPALQTAPAFDWFPLTSVKKVDDHTVRFTLRAPDATFLANRLVTPIVPAHALQGVDPAHMAEVPYSSAPKVSGGPFVFSHRAGGQLVLDANPAFFLGRPHADHVVEQVAPAEVSVPDQLGSGTISWDPVLSPAAAAQAVISSGVAVSSFADTSFVALQFNVRAGHPFAAGPTRQALALSLDHDAVVMHATGASQSYPVWEDVNPSSWAYTPPQERGRDVPGATKLLAGSRPSGSIIYPRRDAQRAAAAALVAQQAQLAGFALTPSGLEDTAYSASMASGTFDVAVVAVPQHLDPDDSDVLATGAALNAGGYSNPALDSLIDTERRATAGGGATLLQVRKPIFSRIEQLLARDLPLYFLWAPRRYMGFSATLGGVTAAGAQLDAARSNTFYLDWFLTG